VFAGYSGVDPVIHDTFRTVYEDMERQQARISPARLNAKQTVDPLKGKRARAFFLDLESKREFHGLELLRSASGAAEDRSGELTDHPNLLTFHRGNEDAFPNLDETFVWLYHVTVREIQKQALASELRRLRYQLFGRPCPEDEALAIIEAFEELCRTERRLAGTLDLPPQERFRVLRLLRKTPAVPIGASRQRLGELAGKSVLAQSEVEAKSDLIKIVRPAFERMTAWTSGFHRLLLREYELAAAVQKNPTEAEAAMRVMSLPWYRPFTEHLQWAAWGAVLELAIRRALAVYVGRPRSWSRISTHVETFDHHCPIVVFRALPWAPGDCGPAARRCITIELAGTRRLLKREPRPPVIGHRYSRRSLAALKPLVWNLLPETVPWWAQNDTRRSERTPEGADLWRWAAFMPQQGSQDLKRFFGW
jgi:hypothetical protein